MIVPKLINDAIWSGISLFILSLLNGATAYAVDLDTFSQLQASGDWEQVKGTAYHIFDTSLTDVSVNLLQNLFGSMGNVLQGTGSQLLGHIYGIFNLGIWVIIGGIVAYTVTMTAVRTSQEGALLVQKLSVLSGMRAVVGVILLLPKYSGYSLVQVLVMWIVVQGVHMANATWTVMLNYANQHQAFVYDQSSEVDLPATKPVVNLAAQVLQSEICMLSIQNGAQRRVASVKRDRAKKKSGAPNPYRLHGRRNKEAMANSNLAPDYDSRLGKVFFGSNNKNERGICGSYTWRDESAPAYYEPYKSAAVNQMVEQLLPLASTIVQSAKETLYDSKKTLPGEAELPSCLRSDDAALEQGNYCPESDLLLRASLDYMTMLRSARDREVQEKLAEARSSDFYKRAKKQGWIMASAYHDRLLETGAKTTPSVKPSDAYLFKVDIGPPVLAKQDGKKLIFQSNRVLDLEAEKALKKHLKKDSDLLIYALRHVCDPLGLGDCNTGQEVFTGDGYARQSKQLLAIQAGRFGKDFDLSMDTGDETQARISGFMAQEIEAISLPKVGKIIDVDKAGQSFMMLDMLKTFGIKLKPMRSIKSVVQQFVKDFWEAWVRFSGPERTGVPTHDMRQLGLDWIVAASTFFADLTKVVFDHLWMLALNAGAYALFVLQIGGLIKYVGTKMIQIGLAMMAGIFWFIGAILIGVGYVFKAVGAGIGMLSSISVLIFGILIALSLTYLPLMLAIGLPVMVMGVILGVYVPLLPFLLFSFTALGWLIAVIESITASPLIALGVAHPERHDYLGGVELAGILIITVFLRPVTMILGLAAAMMLSIIMIPYVNEGFVYLLEQFFNYWSSNNFGLWVILVGLIGTSILYILLIMSLIRRVYSLIHQLGDRLMRWIGAPSSEESIVPTMIQQVFSGFQQTVGQMSQAGAQMTGSVMGGALTRVGGTGGFYGIVSGMGLIGEGVKGAWKWMKR